MPTTNGRENGSTFGKVEAPVSTRSGAKGIPQVVFENALKLSPLLGTVACAQQQAAAGAPTAPAEVTKTAFQPVTNTPPEATSTAPAPVVEPSKEAPVVEPSKEAPVTAEVPSPVPTLSFEEWAQSSQPEANLLKQVEAKYAAAIGVKPESIVTTNKEMVLNGVPVVVVVDSATNTPLFISDTNEKGERVWSEFTFDRLAGPVGKRWGVEALDGDSKSKMSIINSEFNQIQITAMSWKRSQPSQDSTSLTIPQEYLTKALAAGETPTFAALVYGNSTDIPDWLKDGDFSRDQLIAIMQNHVKAVMESNRALYDKLKEQGKVNGDVKMQYIVVNEAINEPDYFWQKKIGPEYVELAFQAARLADPQAVLLYNDYQHELSTGRNANGVFNLVKNLKDKGLIDGVGMQFHFIGRDHFDPNTPVETLEKGFQAQIEKYASIGVPVYGTEFDVDLSKLSGTPEQKLQKAVDIYRMMGRLFGKNPNFVELSVYGLSSESSWVKDLGGDPLLLYTDYKPNAAFYAALTGFYEGVVEAQAK